MRALLVSLAALAILGCAHASSDDASRMTSQQLDRLIRELGTEVDGQAPVLSFNYLGVPSACIWDAGHDRMRIIAPIKGTGEVSAGEIASILQANFHSALDARYAVSDGVLYAAFIHPLGSLTETELRSALSQVANLVRTFGTTYSSGVLEFGGGGGGGDGEPDGGADPGQRL